MVVHVHGNMHGLHLHYCKYKHFMRRNGTINLFCDESITKYSSFNTKASILEMFTDWFVTISSHHNNHFKEYRMILHDKNLISDMVNANPWEMTLLVESIFSHMNCFYHWCSFYQSGPYYFYFSLWLWRLHLTQHIGLEKPCLAIFYFSSRAIGPFSTERWLKFRPHRHRCPWFLW